MRKSYFGLFIIGILSLAACAERVEPPKVLPTLALTRPVELDVMPTEAPHLELYITPTNEPIQNPEAAEAVEPTAEPVVTKEVQPTISVTEEPELTSTLSPAPEPTGTQRPTPMPTSTPCPTVTPTKVPVPTSTPHPTHNPMEAFSIGMSPEIAKLMKDATVYRNTIMQGKVCKSMMEAMEEVRLNSFSYCTFAVIVEDAKYLCSAEDYMAFYPEIESMELEKIEIYRNGICAFFKNVDVVYDANLCYAIRTGDMSLLTDTEQKVYAYLKEVMREHTGGGKNRAEKVKALHDYLVLELKYDSSFRTESHSPEGVMKNQTAVCDGYARTMRLLLLLSGIDCKMVSGTAGGESHAWNLVEMEDGWYHVDVTWDDPVPDVEGKVSHLYFLRNDADMKKTHVWESDISCAGNRYQVYSYQEVLCDSEETLQAVYESQIQQKEYLVFCYPKDGTVTKDMIFEYIMQQAQVGLSYYPEKEIGEYLVLEIQNPLLTK